MHRNILAVRLRPIALGLILLASTAKFASVVHEHYPIQHWLLWRYLSYWSLLAVVGVSCLSAGTAVLRALRVTLPRAERCLMSFALGLYLWFLCTFIGGLFGILGPVFAIALPIVLAAPGLPVVLHRARRYRRFVAQLFSKPLSLRTPFSLVLGLFAFGGLLLIYVPTMTPANIAADSYWYHLTLAQHYAAQGGIGRLPEGSFVGAYPQLATVLYTWAFVLPRTVFFDRIEISAHLEFLIFLWTLLGIGVVAARVIPRKRVGFTWAAMLLFPGLFLYDSNLSVAADHVLAFWGPPIFLALLRAWERLELKRCLLLAVMLSGAALTKYQAGCLVIVPVFALVARAIWLSLRPTLGQARLRNVLNVMTTGLALVLLTAPHWLKNAIWYHDPLYPMLHARLPVRPWSEDATVYWSTVFSDAFWRPTGTLAARLIETTKALFTFSLAPHDWGGFHGLVPVFGSLFTFGSLCLPFLRAHRRLWSLVLLSYSGIFLWYWISHQDRYLQALLPWMAAATGAVLVKIWQSGVIARVTLASLLVLQIGWGSDVPFIPTHMLINTTPFKKVLDLAATGYQKNYEDRLRAPERWTVMRGELPKHAKVLIHGELGPLGLGRMIVTDSVGWQGGISYGARRSPADLDRLLKSFGVTHVVWIPDWGPRTNSIADDLVFYTFANQYLVERWTTGDHQVARLSGEPLPDKPFGSVLFWDKGGSYARGLYNVASLRVPGYGRHDPSEYPPPFRTGDFATLLAIADFVVLDPSSVDSPKLDGFKQVMKRGAHEIWARSL